MSALLPPNPSDQAPPAGRAIPAFSAVVVPGRPSVTIPLTDAGRVALEWSVTRHRLLCTCERAIYWQYWASRGGYAAPIGSETRQAWVLKHLVSLPTLIGTAVHSAAQTVVAALRDERALPTLEALSAQARWTLNQVWRTSQPGQIHEFWQWPGRFPAYREFVHDGGLDTAAIEQGRIKLASCLRHLLAAPLLNDLRACRAAEIRLSGSGPERVLLDGGITVWVALDLLYRHADPGGCRHLVSGPCWCVTDYKTGRPSPGTDRFQLGVYGLALEAQGYPMTDGGYLGRVVYLLSGTETWHFIGRDEMDLARAVIAADVGIQRGFVPEDAGGALQSRDRFALAADRRACATCNYFSLCRSELQCASIFLQKK